MATTRSKAVAGGIAANLTTIALWLVTLVPNWEQVPDAPAAAIVALISGSIGYLTVYYAPSNKTTMDDGD